MSASDQHEVLRAVSSIHYNAKIVTDKFLTAFCTLLFISGVTGCGKDTVVQPMSNSKMTRSKSSPTPIAQSVKYYLYLPTPDGKFNVRVETDPKRKLTRQERVGPKGIAWSVEAAHEALNRLLKAAPQSFPPGTKMISRYTRDGGPPTINLNRAFLNVAWWKESVRGRAAIYALTNTATHTREWVKPSSDEESLRFLVEGKPLKKLGNLDLSKPIEADYRNLP